MITKEKRVSCAKLTYANDYEKGRMFFPFNKESIEANVPDGVMPGNYRIGCLRKSGYHVIYCPNRDCTGSGFDLTTVLEDCLRSKKEVTGTIRCNGKEDAKYAHASGCSCMTTCTYKMIPVVK